MQARDGRSTHASVDDRPGFAAGPSVERLAPLSETTRQVIAAPPVKTPAAFAPESSLSPPSAETVGAERPAAVAATVDLSTTVPATADPSAPEVLTVSQLTGILRGVVEQCFPDVWVAGEVSNCTKAGSGHIYFTLKDADAQLKACLWRTAAQRLKFDVRDGLQVMARGALEVYPPRGQYQLICEALIPQGLGGLELALRQLHDKLAAEGLFAPERKRPLPRFPRRIALVTSPHGAAIHDLLQVLRRRWRLADVILLPVAVQGATAAPQIARAIHQAANLHDVDVIITGRGGGSLEDLWAFNEEVVVRAIAASPVPVVSAVGHEVDVTLADLVADRRALTPSEAAELVVPLASEQRENLDQLAQRLSTALRQRVARTRLQLDTLAERRCFARPKDRFREFSIQLDEIEGRLARGVQRQVASARQQLDGLTAQLDALSPLAVLARGYSLTKRLADGALLRSADQVVPGETLSTLLAQGSVTSVVSAVIVDD